jgi:hypothetical protein
MPGRTAQLAASLVARTSFPAVLVAAGPNSEADPGGNLYWVQETNCPSTSGSHLDGCPLAVKTGGLWVVAQDSVNATRVYAVDGSVNVVVHFASDRAGKPRFFFRHSLPALTWRLITDTGSVSTGSGNIATELGLSNVPVIYWEKIVTGAWTLAKEIRPYYKFPTVLKAEAVKGVAWERNSSGLTPPGGSSLVVKNEFIPGSNSTSIYGILYLSFVLEDFAVGSLAWGSEPSLSSEVGIHLGSTSAEGYTIADLIGGCNETCCVPLLWPRFGGEGENFNKMFGPSIAAGTDLYGCRLRWELTGGRPGSKTWGNTYAAVVNSINLRPLVYA